MQNPAEENRTRFIQKTVEEVFGAYLDWKPVSEISEVGPYDQRLCDAFRNDARLTIEHVRDVLTKPKTPRI